MRAAPLLLLLALSACASAPPAPAPAPPARILTLLNLRPCPEPVPPPPVPPVPRDVEALGRYANAEAKARWQTAEQLRACAAQVARAITWVDEVRAWMTTNAPPS